MRYKIEFEFDSESNPKEWYWEDILSGLETDGDSIDYETLKIFKHSGWEQI